MYIPKHYINENISEVLEFIRTHAFGQLITVHDGQPFVTHIPIELEQHGEANVLRGHIARSNPQQRTLNGSALAIFQGPHAYISSSWYGHVNVPTWNYIAVHVTGSIRVLNDDELYASLKSLTDKYEAASLNPVRVENMHDHVLKQMKAIVGFELSMDKIEGKWKLSQNRNKVDFTNIIYQLEQINRVNEWLIAAEMKKIESTGKKS